MLPSFLRAVLLADETETAQHTMLWEGQEARSHETEQGNNEHPDTKGFACQGIEQRMPVKKAWKVMHRC